jgi:hypothetical protein
MRKTIATGLGLLALTLVSAAGAGAQQAGAWLHVRVEEAGKSSKVHVNLPMTVVEAALKATPELIEEHGKVKFGHHHHGMDLADFRAMWKQLAAVGDAEFVTVESDEEDVKVQRKGDTLFIHVDHKRPARKSAEKAPAEKTPASSARKPGEVRVEVPVALVDALLSGEGDQVNIKAAVDEIQKRRGDIVRVHDDDANVRIWIDEQNTQSPSSK